MRTKPSTSILNPKYKPPKMHLQTLLPFLLSLLAIHTTACNPTRRSTNTNTNTTTPNPFKIGTDGPAPPKTLGYALNHMGLITNNLTAMKTFYGSILGMRTLFDVTLTPEYTVTYMGYAQGGRNGTGFQTGTEMTTSKNNMYGLLEIVEFSVSDDRVVASTQRTNTFSHVGLVVPDVVEAQAYLEGAGVEILKGVGVPITEFEGAVPNALGVGGFAGAHLEAKRRLVEAQGLIGWENFLLLRDPDGNLVEIQQQDI
jgi:lactoylglutathione lyase